MLPTRCPDGTFAPQLAAVVGIFTNNSEVNCPYHWHGRQKEHSRLHLSRIGLFVMYSGFDNAGPRNLARCSAVVGENTNNGSKTQRKAYKNCATRKIKL